MHTIKELKAQEKRIYGILRTLKEGSREFSCMTRHLKKVQADMLRATE